MSRKIPYAGRDTADYRPPSATAADPIGPRAIALLRRVKAAQGGYLLENNADREASGRAVLGGFLRRDHLRQEVVYLTGHGQAYLDKLARAH